jgi:hypothetical protein
MYARTSYATNYEPQQKQSGSTVNAGGDATVTYNQYTTINNDGSTEPKTTTDQQEESAVNCSGAAIVLGNLHTDGQDPARKILLSREQRGVLQCKEKLSLAGTTWKILATPHNKTVLNFFIGVPELFQVVVGDGDLQAVAVRKSSRLGKSPTAYAQCMFGVDAKLKDRSYITGQLKIDTPVEIFLRFPNSDDKNSTLFLTLTYSYLDISGGAHTKSDSFSCPLGKLPKSIGEPHYIQYGLVRGEKYKDDIEVSISELQNIR